MKIKKKITSILLSAAIGVISILPGMQMNAEAKQIGLGSEYRSTAVEYNLGDEIYCQVDASGYLYYKMTLEKETIVRLYARTYDPYFKILVNILNSKGERIQDFESTDDTNWGYQQINKVFNLRAGVYYIETTSSYGDIPESDYGYLKLSEVNYSISKITGVKLKPGKKSLRVSWSKRNGTSNYKIQYSTRRNFAKAKAISVPGSKQVVKIKGLKRKKKYYIRVCGCKRAGDYKMFTNWSSIKYKKTK